MAENEAMLGRHELMVNPVDSAGDRPEIIIPGRSNDEPIIEATTLSTLPPPLDALPRRSRPYIHFDIRERKPQRVVDMSQRQSVAEELVQVAQQVETMKDKIDISLGGIALPSIEVTQCLAAPECRTPTKGEELRAVVYNRLLARSNILERQYRDGKEIEILTVYKDGIDDGTVIRERYYVTPQLIFALKIAHTTMYEDEVSDPPTKPLADLALENPYDDQVVEKELLRRRLEKISLSKETKSNDVGGIMETDEGSPTPTMTESIRQEVQRPLSAEEQEEKEKRELAAQVKATMNEVDSVLGIDKQPSKQAAS